MAEATYERYPLRIVLLSQGLSLAIYAIGLYLLGRLGLVYALAYLVFALATEVRVLWGGCRNCYYYGKVCGLGRGWLCARLFRQGDPQRFAQGPATWRTLIPDMLMLLLPLIGGVVGLIRGFSWLALLLLLGLIALSTAGNAWVRGTFLCRNCRQRELGCPAEQLFAGQKQTSS